jgi:hypothetical protein
MTPATPTVDQALSAVTAAEATLKADQASVANIQTAIETATAPLAAAQATVASDITTFNAAIDTAVTALTAAKIPTND